MFIRDYIDALTILSTALESDCSTCFDEINTSIFGDWFYFYPNKEVHEYYAVNLKTERVEFRYKDTWRNPDHVVIISEGKAS